MSLTFATGTPAARSISAVNVGTARRPVCARWNARSQGFPRRRAAWSTAPRARSWRFGRMLAADRSLLLALALRGAHEHAVKRFDDGGVQRVILVDVTSLQHLLLQADGVAGVDHFPALLLARSLRAQRCIHRNVFRRGNG